MSLTDNSRSWAMTSSPCNVFLVTRVLTSLFSFTRRKVDEWGTSVNTCEHISFRLNQNMSHKSVDNGNKWDDCSHCK